MRQCGGWRLCCFGGSLPLARYPKRVASSPEPSQPRPAIGPLGRGAGVSAASDIQRRRWMTGGRRTCALAACPGAVAEENSVRRLDGDQWACLTPFSFLPALTALSPSFLSVACPGPWSYDSPLAVACLWVFSYTDATPPFVEPCALCPDSPLSCLLFGSGKVYSYAEPGVHQGRARIAGIAGMARHGQDSQACVSPLHSIDRRPRPGAAHIEPVYGEHTRPRRVESWGFFL